MSQPPGTPEALSKPPEVKPVKTVHELYPHLDQRDYERRDNKVRGKGLSVAEWYKTKWDGKDDVIYKRYKYDSGGSWGFKATNHAYEKLRDLQGECIPKQYAIVDGQEKVIVEEYIEEQEGSVEAIMFHRFKVGVGRENEYQYPNSELVAKWVMGYLDGMSKIHEKGFAIGDFNFGDIVMAKDGRVVFRDLGNFEDPNNPEYRARGGSVNYGSDLRMFGSAFLSLTEFGQVKGFKIDYNNKDVLFDRSGIFWTNLQAEVKNSGAKAPFKEIVDVLTQTTMRELKDKSSFLVAEAKLKTALGRFFVETGIIKDKPVEASPQKPTGAGQVEPAARLAEVREELAQRGWPPRPGEPGYEQYADSKGWIRRATPREIESARERGLEEYLKGLRLSIAYPDRFLQKYQERGGYSLPHAETKYTEVWGLYYKKYSSSPALEKGPDGSLRLPQSEPIEINKFLDSNEGKILFTEKAKELGLDRSKKGVDADLKALLFAQISTSRLNVYWNYSGRTNGDLAELYHRRNNFAQGKLAEIRAKTYV